MMVVVVVVVVMVVVVMMMMMIALEQSYPASYSRTDRIKIFRK